MRWLFIVLGVVAFLVGTGLICPALAQLSDQGNMPTLSVTLFTVGLFASLGGVWSVAHGVRRIRMS